MTEWIEYVRTGRVADLYLANKDSYSHTLDDEFRGGFPQLLQTQHSKIQQLYDKSNNQYMSMSATDIVVNKDSTGRLHAPDPAPSFSAGNLTIFFDAMIAVEPISMGNGNVGENTSLIIHPDRDLWNEGNPGPQGPSIIEMIGLKYHHTDGKLSRKSTSKPAISIDKLCVTWCNPQSRKKRDDGPFSILIYGYKEFWHKGVFHGYQMKDFRTAFNIEGYEVKKGCDPLRNKFFDSAQEEMGYRQLMQGHMGHG